ncbi:hypothetical protein QVN85_01685 [Oscillibacter valericigenes]|nr:hypothetical protein [Oscillibacter valericigenes]
MASYTTNLNLLKKDPVADASDTFNITTMLNENWDKIDAAMGAARAAEPYSAAKTYAVGDYCTHDGKLYRCTTAITAAEAWNAAHWAETTVAEEFAVLYTALAGKADILTPIPSGVTSCNNLPDGLYFCSSDMLTDCPISTFNGKIFVSLQSRYFQWAIDVGLRQVWYRTDGGGGWGDWTPIATATPPTPHDLLVSSGVTNYGGLSDYSKDQFGKVLVNIAVSVANSTDAQKVVATLPVGFRPISTVLAAGCLQKVDGSQVYARVAIFASGDIRFEGCPTDGSTIYLFGNVSLNAGN